MKSTPNMAILAFDEVRFSRSYRSRTASPDIYAQNGLTAKIAFKKRDDTLLYGFQADQEY